MKIRILAIITCAFSLVACGDSGSDGDGAGASQEPESVSEPITAATGGEVEVAGALLSIEGGALGEDLTIEVDATEPDSELPDFASIRGLVYDFGPDGTTFDPPAQLELPLDGKVPEGKEAVVSWLDGDSWVDLPTEVANGKVSVEVAHFTMFVVRLRGVDASEISCDFEACGGDLVGSWKIIGACANVDEAPAENPFESCGGSGEILIDGSGLVDFAGDDTFSANISLKPVFRYTLPAACVEMAFQTASSCDDIGTELSDEGDVSTCTGDVGTECVCEVSEAGTGLETGAVTGTYVTDGNTVSTTPEGGQAGAPQGYCIDDDASPRKAQVMFQDSILILQEQ